MNRNAYLSQPDVKSFVAWFAARVCTNDLSHAWFDRKTKKWVRFNGIHDAYKQYAWHFRFHDPRTPRRSIFGSSLKDSMKALSLIQRNLDAAIKASDDANTRTWAETLMRWGGVFPGNGRWLQKNETGLASKLQAALGYLSPASNDQNAHKVGRMNSGMTKVYSLLAQDFVIYDTRVAAALTWVIRQYCVSNGIGSVPTLMRYPVGAAKESPRSVNPKCRNPSIGGLVFPPLNTRIHALWNLRASWLMSDVLAIQTS